MRHRLNAAAGAIALAAAVMIPASPASADSFRDSQWYLKSLNASQAQAISKGAGITVAVVDTGTYPHPDLMRNLLTGTDLIPGQSGDGHADNDGHGTNMAAVIAAHGKNKRDGVLGIAPDAKILPVKIGDDADNMSLEAMTRSIRWAADHGAQVINVSAETGPASGLVSSVESAIQHDAVVVSGVGNASKQAIIGYPAAIDGVLAVGATDRNGNHASLSVIDKKVQICAPGVDITTAEPKNRYAKADGTSLSTAIVSGAAALVRAKFPQISGPEVIHRLTATADDIGPPGRDDQCGFGLLNIVKALTADVPPLEATAAPTSAAANSAAGSLPPGYIDPAATTAAAAPEEAEPASSSTPLILGVLAGLVVAGGVVAFLAVRRRRNF